MTSANDRSMTGAQRAAVVTVVASLKSGKWVRPPLNPLTRERARGPEIRTEDGSRAFAFRKADGKIHWFVYNGDGKLITSGIVGG